MEIFLYAFSVMYSPGPVNALGLNAGLTGQIRRTIGFFVGVGIAMFMLLLIFGYTGEALISTKWLPYIALIGAVYTFYLAFKMMKSKVDTSTGARDRASLGPNLTFLNGFIIQALNPKGMLVVLPITTVMFPSANIRGVMILIVSALIAIGGAGAPGVYSALGVVVGRKIKNDDYFNLFNRLMGVLLVAAGAFMFYDFLEGVKLI
ncbi:LysE family translocator [Burkholderia sp. BCC0405]|uniref:LysE family translocator n=1 Tax=Burkholderia sp. BCC0405 TaxID=2676298 RepID=UPI00158E598E|nr:LysE family translocator [Burkholderia sp. BCC0405]